MQFNPLEPSQQGQFGPDQQYSQGQPHQQPPEGTWQQQPPQGYPGQPMYAPQMQQPMYPPQMQQPMYPPPVQQSMYPPQMQQPMYTPQMQQPMYPYPPAQSAMMPQQVVNVNIQQNQPGLFIRALYFLFIGWWAGLIWLNVGYFFNSDDHWFAHWFDYAESFTSDYDTQANQSVGEHQYHRQHDKHQYYYWSATSELPDTRFVLCLCWLVGWFALVICRLYAVRLDCDYSSWGYNVQHVTGDYHPAEKLIILLEETTTKVE
jgi:hypothetical protein